MDKKIKKSLRYSLYEGVATAIMEGSTSSFIVPFAIALNASVGVIAALAYLPQLAGAFIHLLSAKIVELVKNRKKILVVATFFHALLWLPLLFASRIAPDKPQLIILFIALQAMLSELIGPVWNSLMGDLVPENERGRFFGKRNVITGVTSFISATSAGLLLNHFSFNLFIGFAILFSIAFVSRLVSTALKTTLYESKYDLAYTERFSILGVV